MVLDAPVAASNTSAFRTPTSKVPSWGTITAGNEVKYHKLLAEKRQPMPRTPKAPDESSRLAKYRLELAHHKARHRNLREENSKLKGSLKDQKHAAKAQKQLNDAQIAKLESAIKYLTRTAESVAHPDAEGHV